ncbi:MAG: transcription elongation factor GreA [Anaerolineae bacterium]
MAEEVYLTRDGAEKLRQELDELINVKRPALARKLKEAKEMGDLSENADYIDAKEQQGFLEGRIRYIENLLRAAIVVDEADVPADVVTVGSTVTIQAKGEPPETYTIVGAAEANPVEGKISNESPLGAALLGARVGDKITFNAPVGQLKFKVVEIH